MVGRSVTLGLVALTGFCLLLDGCGSDDSGGSGGAGGGDASSVGSEGQPCYPNDTCNAGLTCLSKLCVDAGSGGTGGGAGAAGTSGSGGSAGTGATGGSAGAGATAGTAGTAGTSADGGIYPICDSGLSYSGDFAACVECLSQNCCAEFNLCTGNADPIQTEQCVADCAAEPAGPLCSDALACQSNKCASAC